MEHHDLQQRGFTPIPSHIHLHHKFIPNVPPVPRIPTSQLDERPNFCSLSFSKLTILQFDEFPNMNLAFYLGLISPNDISKLPDSIITSPRLEKVMACEENLNLPLQLEQSQMQTQSFPRRGTSLATKMPIDVLAAGGGRGGNVTAFSAPGWKTDVKLVVFEKEFHVHSIVLRLYSGFFRNALDVIDREGGSMAPTRRFRYEFGSVGAVALDDAGRGTREGGWTLEKVTEKPQTPSPSPGLPKDQQLPQNGNASPLTPTQDPSEELAFGKLLCAFYNKPFSVSSFQELVSITRLAEQFSALPSLSSSLYVALWHSPVLVSEIRKYRREMLLLAMKLKHRLLFREALIHVVSTWKGYDRMFEGKYRLICTVTKAYNGVCEKVLKVNQEVFAVLAREQDGAYARMKEDVYAVLQGMDRSESLMGNRLLYERLRVQVAEKRDFAGYLPDPHKVQKAEVQETLKGLRDSLRVLLSSKLALERTFGGMMGAEGELEEDLKMSFLCADIEDEDLPWDLDEEDW